MSLVVKWDNVPEATGYELYWSTSKFTLDTLPTDKASIAAGTNLYELTDVKRQTVYWFVIKTLTEGGGSVFGQIFPLGYFPDTGPGPSKLLRGTWEFGFFGEVHSSLIGTADELYSQLVAAGVSAPVKGTATDFIYLKCIVNGKIIFFPSDPLGTTTKNGYNADYISLGVSDASLDDNGAPVVTLKGRDYQHRFPRASNTKPTTTPIVLDLLSNDTLMSEVGMFAALQVSPAEMESAKNADNRNAANVYMRLGDYTGLYDAMTLHRSRMYQASATSIYTYSVNQSSGAIVDRAVSSGWAKPYIPVLELLF